MMAMTCTNLTCFFQRVREAILALHPSQCFVIQQLTFLRYQLRSEGLRPIMEMVDKIQKATLPVTKKQGFMGLTGYYGTFVPNFAAIAVPLTDLTRKESPPIS